jgi:RNA polymerase sigma-70 factor, ECF subfamily
MAKPDTNKMFLEAYDSYADAIFRHCYFRVFSKARAQELVQDTFMKTWEYLEGGKEVRNIRAFLYQVANNLIIDESRKRKEESLDALTEGEGFEPASEEHIKVERAALHKEVLRHIHKLPQEDREVFVMRYVDDLDPREIAEILGTTPNAISVRLHRAVKAVQSLVEQ